MEKFVWVFSCASGRFPGGIFSEILLAEKWIADNGLSGVLTRYPLDVGSFDWAKSKELVNSKFIEAITPEKVGSFSSASFEHHHYETGVRE